MKEIWQSKTFWFNALTVVITLATFLGFTPNQELAETTTSLLLALSPLVNIALRTITNQGIKKLW